MDTNTLRSQPSFFTKLSRTIQTRYQSFLDASTPHTLLRWAFSIIMLICFMARVVLAEGWYIVAYGLGIYYLNLLIAFLTPKIDPAFEVEEDGPSLPMNNDEEFRPFIRRLPEFKFWHAATRATLFSIFLTFFELFNIPVFWPILLIYFITLFGLTMKRQIRHMIKYHYLPWTHGKTTYKGKEDSGKVVYSKTMDDHLFDD